MRLYRVDRRNGIETFSFAGDEATQVHGYSFVDLPLSEINETDEVFPGQWVQAAGSRKDTRGRVSDMPIYDWRPSVTAVRRTATALQDILSPHCIRITLDVEGELIDIFRPRLVVEGAVDFEKSDGWRLPDFPDYLSIEQWAFHDENVPRSGVFTVADVNVSPVFITGDIVDQIITSGARNVAFLFVWSSAGEVLPDLSTDTEPSTGAGTEDLEDDELLCDDELLDDAYEHVPVALGDLLSDSLREEVAEAAIRGTSLIGQLPDTTPEDALEAVDDWLHGHAGHEDVDADDLIAIGVIAGEQFCRGLGWHWATVHVGPDTVVGVIDPSGACAILPIVRAGDGIRGDTEPTFTLTYALLAAGQGPAANGAAPILLW